MGDKLKDRREQGYNVSQRSHGRMTRRGGMTRLESSPASPGAILEVVWE